MRRIELTHKELRELVNFSDPFIHSMEKEEEILSYYNAGKLRPPSLIEYNSEYYIFNGNHRILVAINNELTITCQVLENLEDILQNQKEEGDRYRDISDVSPLTFKAVVEYLIEWSEDFKDVKPEDWAE